MRLLRVQIPSFRVLKNVDIEFEKEYTPQVFPLGSQNGGGKSTLLQLIFILLHCSTKDNRLEFIKNMIKGFKVFDESHLRSLAIIDILDTNKIIKLDFFVCDELYISTLLKQDIIDPNFTLNVDNFNFSNFRELKNLKNKIARTKEKINQLKNLFERLESVGSVEKDSILELRFDRIYYEFKDIINLKTFDPSEVPSPQQLKRRMDKEINTLESNYLELISEHKKRYNISIEFSDFLAKRNILYITNYSSNENEDENENENEALVCRVQGLDITQAKSFLDSISNKIFLAAPSTNVFLFHNQEARKLLFKNIKITDLAAQTYNSHIHQAKDKLSGLFTYDFLSVALLIESFKAVRDRDFKEAIEKGEYGNHYKTLLNNLNSMLSNTQLSVKADLSGVAFKMNNNDETIELYPEDLSHGELKRLSIYMWLTHLNIQDSIVLMDEIEIALHPDWQYNIILDLVEWAPTNQYILATHSYELCRAVTPAHVKELEPRLLKQED